MHFQTLTSLIILVGLVGLVSSLAVPRQTYSSECPFNYPATLNSTESRNGLILTVVSNNPITRDRAVQLRTMPSAYGSAATQVAAIDSTSPVLLGQFFDGSIHSMNRSVYNELYDLGQTARLTQVPDDGVASSNASRYAFQFGDFKTKDEQFYLAGGTDDGTYNVYRHVGDEIVNGFILCGQDQNSWYQLYYQTYRQAPPERPNCEYVGVRTTAAASIFNGKCEIGGYTA